jgi:hypothetical protein
MQPQFTRVEEPTLLCNHLRIERTFPVTAFERSRWRGGRFACYAPHVMPQRNVSNCGSRTCSFSKYRKTNGLRMGEKIEFP